MAFLSRCPNISLKKHLNSCHGRLYDVDVLCQANRDSYRSFAGLFYH